MEGLIDVYSDLHLFQRDRSGSTQISGLRPLDETAPILFEDVRFKGSPGREDGDLVIVDYATFKTLFDESTRSVLQKVRLQEVQN